MSEVDLVNAGQSCLFTQRLVYFFGCSEENSFYVGLKVVKCATAAGLRHVAVCRRAGSSKERAVSGLACLGLGNNKFIYKVNYTAPQVVIEDLSNHQEKTAYTVVFLLDPFVVLFV